MKSKFKSVCISGVASVVPNFCRKIEQEASSLELTTNQINRMKKDIGIQKRHILKNDTCTSDLCEDAAKVLLSELGYELASIDSLIMVTQTPDYFQPATSCVLHGKLGLDNHCAAFDVNLGCSGYVYGLWISSMMINTSSAKRVLLLAGDTLTRCISSRDRAVLPLFGDAGSATVIEKSTDNDEINFTLHSDGTGYNHLLIPAGGFRKRPSMETAKIKEYGKGLARSDEHLYMNGAEIFNFSIKEVPSLIEDVLIASKWNKEEVDFYILHQANKFIISNIARKLGIPIEKVPYDVFEKYGNQSSASIPVVLCEDLNSEVSTSSKKVILAGFGSGLSWGACALHLGPTSCIPVILK